MKKSSLVIIAIIVLISAGVLYSVMQNDSKKDTNQQSNTSAIEDSETDQTTANIFSYENVSFEIPEGWAYRTGDPQNEPEFTPCGGLWSDAEFCVLMYEDQGSPDFPQPQISVIIYDSVLSAREWCENGHYDTFDGCQAVNVNGKQMVKSQNPETTSPQQEFLIISENGKAIIFMTKIPAISQFQEVAESLKIN